MSELSEELRKVAQERSTALEPSGADDVLYNAAVKLEYYERFEEAMKDELQRIKESKLGDAPKTVMWTQDVLEKWVGGDDE